MFNAMPLKFLFIAAGLVLPFKVMAGHADGAMHPSVGNRAVTERIVVTLEFPTTRAPLHSPSGRMNYLPPSPREWRRVLDEQAREIASAFDLEIEQQWPIMALGVNCVVYRVSQADVPEDSLAAKEFLGRLMSAIDARAEVDAVQELNTFSTATAETAAADVVSSGFSQLLAEFKTTATGRNVKVAVIDTGVDLRHKALRRADITTKNLVGEESASLPAETHGTAVIGVLLAGDHRELGIRGAIPDASTRLLRACWEVAADSDRALCNTFTLARALAVAIEWPADIVNLSISGPRDPLLERLGTRFSETGGMVIAAGTTRNGFPGSVPGSILAADHFDASDSAMTLLPGDRFGLRKGSSVAAAQMTALAALAKERRPSLDNHTLLDYLAEFRQRDPVRPAALKASSRKNPVP